MQNTLNTLTELFCRNGLVLVIEADDGTGASPPDGNGKHLHFAIPDLARAGIESTLKPVLDDRIGTGSTVPVLVVLDRIWDRPLPSGEHANGWRSRREFYRRLRALLPDQCELILIADDPANLRNPKLLIRTLLRLLCGNRRQTAFSGRYIAELKAEGFGNVDRFHVVPELESMRSLISAHRRASLSYLRRVHRQTMAFPKDPTAWPKWIAIWCGLGQRVIPTQLLWAHR